MLFELKTCAVSLSLCPRVAAHHPEAGKTYASPYSAMVQNQCGPMGIQKHYKVTGFDCSDPY